MALYHGYFLYGTAFTGGQNVDCVWQPDSRDGDREHREKLVEMLNVFITVDTEVYPLLSDWRVTGLAGDISRDIDGQTREGDFGLRYQLQLLNEYGLKAVFFVESLFASSVGLEPLRRIVNLIQQEGHEVQLHVHPEWLEHIPSSVWGGQRFSTIREFSEEDQTRLISLALSNLRACGAGNINAFRAGDYAANFDTLRALARNGVAFDTSYNYCHLPADFQMASGQPLLQPACIPDVCEFPVSFFSDWPGHNRHAQVTACSYAELTNALMQASERHWFSFVIVLHSMELLMDRRRRLDRPRADRILIRRFRRLCEFLASHRDKFRTATFGEFSAGDIPATVFSQKLVSPSLRTVSRFAEQGIRRVWGKVLR